MGNSTNLKFIDLVDNKPVDYQIVGDEKAVDTCTSKFVASRGVGPNLKKFVRPIEIDDIVAKHHHHN